MKRLHLTADKGAIKDFPKLPSATSFIRKTLSDVAAIYYNSKICFRLLMLFPFLTNLGGMLL